MFPPGGWDGSEGRRGWLAQRAALQSHGRVRVVTPAQSVRRRVLLVALRPSLVAAQVLLAYKLELPLTEGDFQRELNIGKEGVMVVMIKVSAPILTLPTAATASWGSH